MGGFATNGPIITGSWNMKIWGEMTTAETQGCSCHSHTNGTFFTGGLGRKDKMGSVFKSKLQGEKIENNWGLIGPPTQRDFGQAGINLR